MSPARGSRRSLVLAAVLAAVAPACKGRADLPVMGPVGAFTLTAEDGRAFGTSDLRGRPWVASFFFTSCVTVCPRVLGGMKRLQEALAGSGSGARLVSLTVDPETDTPERLRDHARSLGADPARWTFLTGSPADVLAAVTGALKTHMGEREETPQGLLEIGHGARLLLVDGEGRLRGLYDPDDASVDRLARDLRDLENPQ